MHRGACSAGIGLGRAPSCRALARTAREFRCTGHLDGGEARSARAGERVDGAHSWDAFTLNCGIARIQTWGIKDDQTQRPRRPLFFARAPNVAVRRANVQRRYSASRRCHPSPRWTLRVSEASAQRGFARAGSARRGSAIRAYRPRCGICSGRFAESHGHGCWTGPAVFLCINP